MKTKIMCCFMSLCAVLCLLAMMCGCSRRVYVPGESVRTDTVYRGVARVDSVVSSDTVRILQRGDTVFSEVIKWRTRVKERRDTIKEVRLEVKEVPYPVEVPVKRGMSWWEKILVTTGGVAMIGMALYIALQHKRNR